MDRLRPPRPALTFGEKGLALTHTPPTYASHVALYLYDADGRKRFLDADKNELLAPGETGGAQIRLTSRARSRPVYWSTR